jgi:TorA maturation chaperone TorD
LKIAHLGWRKRLQVAESTDISGLVNKTANHNVSPEDEMRAQIYRLLAGFLSRSPDRTSLDACSILEGDDGEFGKAISNFAKMAGHITQEAADTEFHDLFIGVTRGELLPFGSYYQTGFLNEKPLANLRADMAKLGIARVGGLKEPEDHIASVLEIMAGLIEGIYGVQLSLTEQRNFFETHVNSWASHFFKDLEGARYSVLYAPLGTIGGLFMTIEQSAFEMS